MSMSRNARLWNLAASVIAIITLIAGAGRLKAFFLSGQTGNPPAVSEVASRSQTASDPEPKVEQKSAQPEQSVATEPTEETGSTRKEIFLWINFLLIVALLWYLSKKHLGPYLQTRAQSIREDMELSKKALEDAGRRLSDIENRLQRLDEEIGGLRQAALQEASAERTRIEEAAKADTQKIARAAEQEIAAAAKAARKELKVYAAELAVNMAEKRIQSSISPESEKGIFRTFLEDLSNGSTKRGAGTASGQPRNGGA